MLLAGSALRGYAIEASDGRIGTVTDLLFDDTTWKIRWVVVDTGTWLTTRKVLLHPSAVERLDYERQELSVVLSKHQIEASPSILQDQPVSAQMERNLYDYYGWDPLWGGSYFGTGGIASPLSPPPYFGSSALREPEDLGLLEDDGDPHLRSLAAVTGYHILATDGEIGHVENVLIDDATWGVRYLIVDTSNWWLGKHVLISPYAVGRISYVDRQITVDIGRDKVKSSPPWDAVEMIDTYYEKRLHSHYGWQGYGW
jgi:sporulation protein YlmC with PRC-barrel domain